MDIRTGIGYDVHQLAEGRDFWLGGIAIPHHLGSVGHSDADVLLHALCDALLGALALGDIGTHFPDTDPQYKGIDSKKLLKHVYRLIRTSGWQLINLDSTICLEQPKIKPHIPAMTRVIESILEVEGQQRVSIKATTTEKMGYVGRQEGVSAYCVVLLARS